MFSVKVDTSKSSKIWLHWKRTFQSYLWGIEDVTDEVKLDILVSLLDIQSTCTLLIALHL